LKRKIYDFFIAHWQLATGVVLGCIIAQIIIISINTSAPEIKAALIGGSFNLMAAIIAIVVGYLTYKSAHVPFERRRGQAINIIKNYVLSTKHRLELVDRHVGKDVKRRNALLKHLCRIDIFCFEKEYIEVLPNHLLKDVFIIKENFVWLKDQLSYYENIRTDQEHNLNKELIEDTIGLAVGIFKDAQERAANF